MYIHTYKIYTESKEKEVKIELKVIINTYWPQLLDIEYSERKSMKKINR